MFQWVSVSELNKLPKLTDLRMDLNPILKIDSRATNRQLIIARIDNLKVSGQLYCFLACKNLFFHDRTFF